MGKKLLFGCLGLLVIGIVVGAILGYFYVYQPAREYVATFSELGKVAEMNDQIEQREPFDPPADDVLTQEQVDRFVAVQRHIVTSTGTRLDELEQKYSKYEDSPDQTPGIGDLLDAWKDLKSILAQVKEAQIEGINEQEFSLEEYRWVRSEFYQAMGANIATVNLEQAIEAVQAGDLEEVREKSDSLAPEENQELVAPYKEEAGKWLAYAWLGI